MRVLFKGSAPDGLSEVRGEFWDLGRMNADDPRLAGYDLRDDLPDRSARPRGRARDR